MECENCCLEIDHLEHGLYKTCKRCGTRNSKLQELD